MFATTKFHFIQTVELMSIVFYPMLPWVYVARYIHFPAQYLLCSSTAAPVWLPTHSRLSHNCTNQRITKFRIPTP